jgi:hypothetical protein
MLCSQPVWPTVTGIVLPKLNRIPVRSPTSSSARSSGKGVKFLQDDSLSCQVPGRFRVHLSATSRGTLVQGTKSTSLSPRQTETPRPASRGVVEVWREPPEAR